MDTLLPWSTTLSVIEPVYPKAGCGRRPYPLNSMLSIHCMQQWYNFSDGGAMEDALYEIAYMRLFAKRSLQQAIHHHELPAPVGTTSTGTPAIRVHQPMATLKLAS